MQYTIKNNDIVVTIDDKGAELQSIKTASEDREIIWTAQKEYWARHAPNLFPIVGGLKENRYEYKGQSYTMKSHGFARNSVFKCTDKSDNCLEFLLRSSEATKESYPFDFNLYVIYMLNDNKLDITYRVENLTDGEMYFSIGAHPGFLCLDALEDYVIEFDSEESDISWQLNSDGIIDPKAVTCPFENDKKTIKLTKNLFDMGVYVFKNPNSTSVSLRNIKTNKSVTVKYDGFKYLGIWAPEDAPFVCLEPWYGMADIAGTSFDYTKKEGIEKLEKGSVFECMHSIAVK